MINLTGLQVFAAKLEEGVNRIVARWEATYAEIVRACHWQALEGSPQWSGNFVANWNIDTGRGARASARYQEFGEADKLDPNFVPLFRGDPAAMAEAVARNPMPERLPLTHRAVLSNNTPYGMTIYRNKPNEGHIGSLLRPRFLRPGNYIDPNNVPIDHVKNQFAGIVRKAVAA